MTLDNNDHLRELVGELGANLRLIERAFGVDINQRGCSLSVRGKGVDSEEQCEIARRVLVELTGLIAGGHAIHPSDVLHAVRILRTDPQGDLKSFFKDVVLIGVNNRPIIARSAGQRRYLASLRTHEVAFGVGPAGTGKTYLGVAVAVAALKRGAVRRIVLTRPAVEAGEKLGFCLEILQRRSIRTYGPCTMRFRTCSLQSGSHA
jgi:phosphate starvation-inducible PhoH-like protein